MMQDIQDVGNIGLALLETQNPSDKLLDPFSFVSLCSDSLKTLLRVDDDPDVSEAGEDVRQPLPVPGLQIVQLPGTLSAVPPQPRPATFLGCQ